MTDTTGTRSVAAKICGLTRPADALHAEREGASYLGVILASGPRLLDIPRAADVLGPRRPGVARVGVFGSQSVDMILDTSDRLELDVVQLHGETTPRDIVRIRESSGRIVWPVLRVAGSALPGAAASLGGAAGWLVLDAHVVGQLGGTGVSLDWGGLRSAVDALRGAEPTLRIVLAGGLRPDNVEEAITLLAPDVADVSSGVESAAGVKDPVLVSRFVNEVRTVTRNARIR